MVRPMSRFLRLSGIALALLLSPLAWARAANAEDVPLAATLRPSYQTNSYIQSAPDPELAGSFADMIRRDAGRSGSAEAAGARWQGQVEGISEREAALLPAGALFANAGVSDYAGSTRPYGYGVKLVVPLYDGGAGLQAVAAQRASAQAAQASALDTLTGNVLDLVAAAAALHLAEETMAVRRNQMQALQALVAETEAERAAGTASSVDASQVAAEIVRLQLALNGATTARDGAIQSYVGISGTRPGAVGRIGSIGQHLPRSLKDALDQADRTNPRLARQLDIAEAARFDHLSSRAGAGPDLNLDLSLGASGDYRAGSAATEAKAMFRLELPLSLGTGPAIRRKALEAQAADLEAQAARNLIHASVEAAFARVDAARQARGLAAEALDRARAVLEGIKVERELGERTVFDLISAHNSVAEARISVLDVEREAIVAEHLLAAETGVLLSVYGLDIVGRDR